MPGDEGREHPDDERPEADVDARLAADQLADLEDARRRRDRGRHQEAEPGGRLAVQPGEAGRPRS